MNNDDTLISKLIAETCSEEEEATDTESLVDLRKYFEKRLNEVDYISIADYLNQNHLTHQNLDFQKKSKCFRLVFKQSMFDFPSNWSVFKDIECKDLIFIDPANDKDYLLDIFSELCGSSQHVAVIKESENVQLVFLPEETSYDHVKWMRNYFEKKSAESKEAA